MSYKVSKSSSTNAKDLRVVVQASSDGAVSPESKRFWRTWLEFGSEGTERPIRSSRLNWDAVLGIVLVIGIGAAFWTGVGLLISRLVG